MNSVFIVGHPRSGTTFLHNFLASASSTYTGQTLSHLVDDVWPLSFLIRNNSFWNFLLQNIFCNPRYHKVRWEGPESLDVGQFFFNGSGYLDFIYKHVISNQKIDSNYIESYLENNIRTNHEAYKWYSAKEEVSLNKLIFKSFSAPLFGSLLEENFGRPKVIVLKRSLDAILQSYTLMLKSVMRRRYFFKLNIPNFEDNLSNTISFYQNKLKRFINCNPQYCVIEYNQLINNFTGTIKVIQKYIPDIHLDASKIAKQAVLQKNHKRIVK